MDGQVRNLCKTAANATGDVGDRPSDGQNPALSPSLANVSEGVKEKQQRDVHLQFEEREAGQEHTFQRGYTLSRCRYSHEEGQF